MIKIIAIYRRILGKQAIKHGLVFKSAESNSV